MRLGLLGGAFNPIHHCHLAIAAQTRDRLGLTRILFVPTGDPPHKPPTSLAPAAHRYEMVKLAIAADPTFAVSDVELERPGKSYAIDTIQALSTQRGPSAELFFILGLDSFLEFPSWKHTAELLRLCHFVVVSRPGTSFGSLAELPLLPPMDRPALQALDNGREDRLDIALSKETQLILLQLPPCTVSASEIRRRLMTGESLASLLPAPVESYIIQHALFREDTDRTRL